MKRERRGEREGEMKRERREEREGERERHLFVYDLILLSATPNVNTIITNTFDMVFLVTDVIWKVSGTRFMTTSSGRSAPDTAWLGPTRV